MAAASPLAGLPNGTFPVTFSPALEEALHPPADGGKKRKRSPDEMVALRYNFKPSSITSTTPGVYTADGTHKRVSFDVGGGVKQVFEAQEETSRVRDCVLLWDPESQAFTLHPLAATYQLTLSRGLSGPGKPPAPASIASTTSSGSSGAPLARRKSKTGAASSANPNTPAVQTPPKAKMVAPGDLTPRAPDDTPGVTPRSTKGGKSLPRKTISTPTFAHTPTASSPLPIPTPTAPKTKPKTPKATVAPAKGKAKAKSAPGATAIPATAAIKAGGGGKKGAPKKAAASAPKAAPKGKIKSAEIIEDEDDEDDDDEFARMVGESIAAAQPPPPSAEGLEDDDDEEEEEDDSEEDELGGAKLVGRSSAMDGDSEWL